MATVAEHTPPASRPPPTGHLAGDRATALLRGLLAIGFGIVVLVQPQSALLAAALGFAMFPLADGALGLIAAVRCAVRKQRWSWRAVQGSASLLAGALALFWPGLTVVTLMFVVAAWALLSGAVALAVASRSSGQGRWLYTISGALSVLFGALLMLAPVVGAEVLIRWVSVYAVVYGVILVTVALTSLSPASEGR